MIGREQANKREREDGRRETLKVSKKGQTNKQEREGVKESKKEIVQEEEKFFDFKVILWMKMNIVYDRRYKRDLKEIPNLFFNPFSQRLLCIMLLCMDRRIVLKF